MCVCVWKAALIYYIMEEESIKGGGDRAWRCKAEEEKAGQGIQFVMDQMLYPPARYFTPNGTCKNSICWNRPWNMSALAEGSSCCAQADCLALRMVCCQMYPMGCRGKAVLLLWHSDSRAGAAAACVVSGSPREEEWGRERERARGAKGGSYHNMESLLLNVRVAVRVQIPFSSECR